MLRSTEQILMKHADVLLLLPQQFSDFEKHKYANNSVNFSSSCQHVPPASQSHIHLQLKTRWMNLKKQQTNKKKQALLELWNLKNEGNKNSECVRGQEGRDVQKEMSSNMSKKSLPLFQLNLQRPDGH